MFTVNRRSRSGWLLYLFVAGLQIVCFESIWSGTCHGQEIATQTIVVPDDIVVGMTGDNPGSILLALKITNISSHRLLINKTASPTPEFRTESNVVLRGGNILERSVFPQERDVVWLDPGFSTYLVLEGAIVREQGRFIISGPTHEGGIWRFDNVKPGKYSISLNYYVGKDSLGRFSASFKEAFGGVEPWSGDIVSVPVSLTLK